MSNSYKGSSSIVTFLSSHEKPSISHLLTSYNMINKLVKRKY